MAQRRVILWIVLACGLCLIPSGWLIWFEGALVPATKGQSKAALFWNDAKEPLAHGLLMLGVGYSLMRLMAAGANIATTDPAGCGTDQSSSDAAISSTIDRPPSEISEPKSPSLLKPWFQSASMTVFVVMVLAVLIELAQSLLPSSFHRGFSWGDLEASLVGGSIGTFMAAGRAFVALKA